MTIRKSGLNRSVSGSFACVLLVFAMEGEAAAQFLDITVRHEGFFWRSGLQGKEFTRTNRWIVGTNWWLFRETGDYQQFTDTFDGTRLQRDTLIIGYPPTKHPELFKRNHPEFSERIGQRNRRFVEFADGSPLRTMPGASWSLFGKIEWIAFASGEFLRRPTRQLYPPHDLWRQYRRQLGEGPFKHEIRLFEDSLGLPERITLLATNQQPVFEYVVSASTNVMGRTIPVRFRTAQYWPGISNSWQLLFSSEGEVINLGTTTRRNLEEEE